MKRERKVEVVTPKQYAQKHKVAYSTVMKWLRDNMVPGAYKQQAPAPFQGYIYQIPVDAEPPTLKPGPKPQKATEAARSGKAVKNARG